MKKWVLVAVFVTVLLLGLAVSAGAAEIVDSGYCGGEGDGTNLTWTLDSDGVLTISGTGKMKSFYSYTTKYIPWFARMENITTVVIGDGVTNIGSRAFYGCSSLTNVTIPTSVTTINEDTFFQCSSLTNVMIPNGVTSIGDGAFYDCSSLTSVTIPDGVTNIGQEAFRGCTSLTDVIIPAGVTNIGFCMFGGCSSLMSVTICNGITSIEHAAFSGCSSLTSVTIPKSVTRIGDSAFSHCSSLMSVTIQEGVTSIGNSAFSNCINLTNVTIPDSVTYIGGSAFYDCDSLKSVTIPGNVTRIENSTFYSCNALTSVKINDGVTTICCAAFSNCINLKSMAIPVSVTSIEFKATLYTRKLDDVFYGGGKKDWDSINIDYDNFYGKTRIHYYYGAPASQRTPTTSTSTHTSKPASNYLTVEFDGGISAESGQRYELPIYWSFDLFKNDSRRAEGYPDYDLNVAGLVLSANIYNYTLLEETMTGDKSFGFESFHPENQSYPDTEWNKVGLAFAHKTETIGGQTTNVIAVVCRGTYNNGDTIGDFLTQANGFRKAAENAHDLLVNYINEYVADKTLPIKLFITGHSRGGAAANILGTIVSDITDDSNVFVYTYACPQLTTDFGKQNYTNIFNTIVQGDPVPCLPPIIGINNRFGNDFTFDAGLVEGFDSYFQQITHGVPSSALNDPFAQCVTSYPVFAKHHAPATYMACILAWGRKSPMSVDEYIIKKLSFRCPVDVNVLDRSGNLVGSIRDNVADEALLSSGLYVIIDGDEKYVYSTGGQELLFELVGSDSGTMTYSVEEIDMTTGTVNSSQTFSNVALTNGKTMTSAVADDIAVPDTQLLVQANGIVTKEIDEAGNETAVVILSFDTDLGDSIRDMTVPKGSAPSELPTAHMDGYEFAGWYTDTALTNPFELTAALNSSLTLYAKYTPLFDVYGWFRSIAYDGESLTAALEYDYNTCGSNLFVALYQDEQMLGIQAVQVTSGATSATVTLPVSGLYGIYELKAFTLDSVGAFSPISDSAKATFYAN